MGYIYRGMGCSYRGIGCSYRGIGYIYRGIGYIYRGIGYSYRGIGCSYRGIGCSYRDIIGGLLTTQERLHRLFQEVQAIGRHGGVQFNTGGRGTDAAPLEGCGHTSRVQRFNGVTVALKGVVR